MTDLTNRLRSYGPHHHDVRLHFDAADEIERLTDCLKKANTSTEHFERLWYMGADELERATTERDMWKDTLAQRDRELANARAIDIHSCHDGCTRSGCVAGRLREEVAGLREDAERYRWLREQAIDGAPGVPVIAMPNGMRSGYYLNDDTADFAIDAARKAAP
jgi:alkylhydroperoxidase family enzyme